MLRQKDLLPVLGICAVLFAFGCKSEPAAVSDEPAVPEQPAETVAEPAVDEALTALRAEVTALRAQVLEMGFDAANGAVWTDGETSFTSAESCFGKNDGQAKESYEAARLCYEQLMKEGFLALAGKIDAARKDAADAGADERFPEQFAALDARANQLAENGEAGSTDAQTAFNDCSSVLDGYTAMTVYMLGDSLKKRVVALNLVSDAAENPSVYDNQYKTGCDALAEAEAKLADDPAGALAAARSAVTAFSGILDAWFKSCTDTESAKVDALIAQCDEVKAAVAVKDLYAQAAAVRGKAVQLYNGKSYEAAYTEMQEAGRQFEVVYGQAVTKRDAALRAMDEAKKQQDAAAVLAVEANEKAPLEGDDEPEIPLPGEETVPVDETAPVAEPVTEESAPEVPVVTDDGDVVTSETAVEEKVAEDAESVAPITEEASAANAESDTTAVEKAVPVAEPVTEESEPEVPVVTDGGDVVTSETAVEEKVAEDAESVAPITEEAPAADAESDTTAVEEAATADDDVMTIDTDTQGAAE